MGNIQTVSTLKHPRAYNHVELDLLDTTLTACRVFTHHDKLFSFVRMNIDTENCPSSDVYSLLDLTGNDTGHSKQEIQIPTNQWSNTTSHTNDIML